MRPSPAGRMAVTLTVFLAALLLLPGLGTAPFDDPGEGQHAEIARELWMGGDGVTLRLNGVRYFDKPPLLYWLAAGSFALLGPVEWAARLIPLLGAVLAVAGTALLGARLLGPRSGFLAGAALLSCALFAAFGRYLRPESLFLAAIQWGFVGLLLAARESAVARRGWALLGCAALGVAALAKDPLGLVGPLASVGLALVMAGCLRPVARWLPPWGVALLLVIGLGWYALVAARNAGFLWYTVVDNHLLNLLRLRRFPDEDVPLSALEFLTAAALGAFPWSVAASVMIVVLVRRRAWRDPTEVPWVALALWAVGVFALFTLSRFKLPHYGLPAYPAIALLAARAWQGREVCPRALLVTHLALFALAGAGCALVAAGDGRAFSEALFGLSDVYTRKEMAVGQTSPYPGWEELRPLAARMALILLAGSAALAWAAARRPPRRAAPIVAAVMLATVPIVTAGLDRADSSRSVALLAAEIKRRVGPTDVLVHEGPIENSGAIEFYSGRRPVLLDGTRSVLGIGATFPDGAASFWDAERFMQEWAAGRAIYLVTTRAPAHSVVSRLPREDVHLLLVQNGRWLYGRASALRDLRSPAP